MCRQRGFQYRKYVVDSQRKIRKAVMVYKSLNGLTPAYLSSKFVDHSSVSSYSLRDTEGKLAIPQPHTNYMKNSFSYARAVLWNNLPIELRQADSLRAFRWLRAFLFIKLIYNSIHCNHVKQVFILSFNITATFIDYLEQV